jgi:hypothetical protein
MSAFRLVRDARGALVHVRTATGECIGCIEVGLFEIVRQVVEEEERRRRAVEGIPNAAPPKSAAAETVHTVASSANHRVSDDATRQRKTMIARSVNDSLGWP